MTGVLPPGTGGVPSERQQIKHVPSQGTPPVLEAIDSSPIRLTCTLTACY